ncbi:MAG: hypothetical protein E7160_05255 [Firmicutes bacterium]|nr:hypothetical protein [Bacillota bacterium]
MKINTPNDLSENVNITVDENITKIDIKKDCSLMLFYYEITNKLTKEIADKINMSSIFNGSRINKKTLYIIDQNNKVYNISLEYDKNDNIIYEKSFISERSTDNNQFIETTLKFLPNNNFSVTKKDTKNLNNGFKIYMSDKKEQDKFIENQYDVGTNGKDDFILSKRDAFASINSMLNKLESIEGIDKIISTERLFNYVGVIPKNKYIPIIKDNSISISYKDTEENYESFDIVFNRTKEIIGKLILGYDQTGIINSVNYEIYKDYQEKRLETRALKLLRRILEENNIHDNKILNQLPENTKKDINNMTSIKPMQKIKKEKHLN